MEKLVMEGLFSAAYNGKTVLVTGHSGFKGSWLALWLVKLGAKVIGYSKDIPTIPNHMELLDLPIQHIWGDVTNYQQLYKAVQEYQPHIIFHLAAQSLVRYSYKHPIETLTTNIMGTINVLEVAKQFDSIQAIVNVTSDKCYENTEKDVAYKETDRMGGYDIYSVSKGCSELITSSYRNSFFNISSYLQSHHVLIASARAGNVIGGGDWAADRLIPDVVKASVLAKPVIIRNPLATRPWQHVLEPLSGYLLLGQLLLQGKKEMADGWNFGPLNNETFSVEQVLNQMKNVWDNLSYTLEINTQPHEAHLLKLDCTKSNQKLQWKPVWNTKQAIEKTALWYKDYYSTQSVNTLNNLQEYVDVSIKQQQIWTL